MQKLLVNVYRWDLADCTNNGITSKHSDLYLYDGDRNECIANAMEQNIADRALYLVRRELWGERAYYAEPLVEPKIDGPHMMGGNFVYSCDSRFGEMCGIRLPLPVHDRYETWAQYDALSR